MPNRAETVDEIATSAQQREQSPMNKQTPQKVIESVPSNGKSTASDGPQATRRFGTEFHFSKSLPAEVLRRHPHLRERLEISCYFWKYGLSFRDSGEATRVLLIKFSELWECSKHTTQKIGQ